MLPTDEIRRLLRVVGDVNRGIILIAWLVSVVAALSILVGLPELSSRPEASVLLDEGIYGRIRHPRYVDVVLGVLAFALFTNYLAVYVMWVLALPVIWLLTVIEERELLGRFGERYADYRLRVPRFIPRLQNK